ncbi:GbsR/MarR family transcriptional regulator [Novosphingobium sp. JCM 18896]|uniref:GbsR/MarR family transcriptional regulator n=1 Tax=Novosphingobium sp. JCM 18896 TaxID=2989731 RepID=UPI00222305B2|nr:transcriptional regulator [Novosphingobium sp. JCM 18896]MCW1428319.1 transcriptional regulator [Novosphingobium sp. JCM 18896]
MPNMSKPASDASRRRFVEDVAARLTPWGMQPTLARLYGYLLLSAEPVDLDAIAADLDMAKSSASVAARELVKYGLASLHKERGSKRVRYGASERYSGFLVAQATLLGDLGHLVQDQADAVAEGRVLRRLEHLSSFFLKMEATIRHRIDELTEEAIREGLVEEPSP